MEGAGVSRGCGESVTAEVGRLCAQAEHQCISQEVKQHVPQTHRDSGFS